MAINDERWWQVIENLNEQVECRGRVRQLAGTVRVQGDAAVVRVDSDRDSEFWVEVRLTRDQLAGLLREIDREAVPGG